MSVILPDLVDRYLNLRDGRKKFVGKILAIDGGKKKVIAHVYGTTIEEMRARKYAVLKALKEIEK